MTIAIHYTAVRTPQKPGQIYGIQIAILDWLRAWLRHARQEVFTFLVTDEASQKELLAIAAEEGIDPARLKILDGRFPRENFGEIETIFRPDPDPRDVLWQRAYAGASFSFCGLAHAVSGLETAQVLEQFCLAPTSARDAIICPSKAIASAIRHYFEHSSAFMAQRFGVAYDCPVQLPVLPLGVDTARIKARVLPERRAAQRAALGVGADDIVLLWVGRLSYAIKAHPLPMFRAAEEAAKRTGKNVHLVMQGYFVPQESGAEFAALAKDICATAKVHFIAADDVRFPDGLWAAGDIFLSLVDNMQESFGLTPIEAIAAGLPRVISDWDGYRDSVTHGEDGFLVPTIQPPAGAGVDLAATLLGNRETYGGYLALTAQCVAVDHAVASDAIVKLIEEPALRARIADKAKERLPAYDWARLIPAYEDLWAAQREEKQPSCQTTLDARHREHNTKDNTIIHPHAPDPFTMYRAFPSETLTPETKILLSASMEEIQMLFRHKMNTLAAGFMIDGPSVQTLLNELSVRKEATVSDLFSALPTCDKAALWRTIGWLLKLGITLRC